MAMLKNRGLLFDDEKAAVECLKKCANQFNFNRKIQALNCRNLTKA